MIVKKFRGKNMTEVQRRIHEELGGDAVILTTREVKDSGVKGLLNSVVIEATVAIEEADLKAFQGKQGKSLSTGELEKNLKDFQDAFSKTPKTQNPYTSAYTKAQEKGKSVASHQEKVTISTAARQQTHKPERKEEITPQGLRDFSDISKKLKERFGLEPAPTSHPTEGVLQKEVRKEMQRAQRSISSHSNIPSDENKMLEFLVSKGVSRPIALRIEEEIKTQFGTFNLEGDNVERATWFKALQKALAKQLRCGVGIEEGLIKPSVVALVGATGVGKTSTTLKLIYEMQLHKKQKIGLINLGVSKVAAHTRSEDVLYPLGVTVVHLDKDEDLASTVQSFSGKDIIFIDTNGSSPANWQDIQYLANSISHIPQIQTFLVLSATTKDLDIYGQIQLFGVLQPKGLIFTKLDETLGLGFLVNICSKTGRSIEYVTESQEMHCGLLVPNSELIAKKILLDCNAPEYQRVRDLAFA